ncbi:hypothetical protein ILUMI_16071 [Ignelater luminosus]|uniref:Uncharacterized protein n=1 Tax=Ignelater luminosus TaxID=2038154 RepID=A0A8K0CRQ6_IGNLU|nr:hypothetical protein ILUMI_16071 [Ignelater luminosus]
MLAVDSEELLSKVGTRIKKQDTHLRALISPRERMVLLWKKDIHTCTSMHKYFGEFVYDIERAAQLLPGLCPIPQGRYANNFLPDYHKINVQNIPFGSLRATEVAFDKDGIISCLVTEVENNS